MLIANLARRRIEGLYFKSLSEAKQTILNMIPEGATIGVGNSQTLKAMDMSAAFTQRGHMIFDKSLASTKEESTKMKKNALLSDCYITGTNALSLDGRIVNIDHSGNRVAAMLYGPDKVIIVVGINKITLTYEDAVQRVRNHAAPLNAKRAGYNPPCRTLKKCIDCKSPERVCYDFVVIEGQHDPNRMKVVIINQELGY